MKVSDFRVWLKKISQLSHDQNEQVRHCLSKVTPQAAVVKCLEDSFEPRCPIYRADHPYRWGRQAGLQRFHYCAYKPTFTTVSGTPLVRWRHKEQRLNYNAALIEGLTVRASAKQCKIDKNTSLRWRHQFLDLPVAIKANHLQGIVEAEEGVFLPKGTTPSESSTTQTRQANPCTWHGQRPSVGVGTT